MELYNPDLKWYSSRSKEFNLSLRCPIASAELCPRYYNSYLLLGREGVTTKISDKDQLRLERKWKPFASVVAEEDVGMTRSDNKLNSISGICPEVAFEIYGYFASGLYRYADELDSDLAQERLIAQGINDSDYRWQWSMIIPRHYTECREYSIYSEVSSGKRSKAQKVRTGLSAKVRWQVLARDAFTCKYCGRRPPEVSLEIDHKISVADGGNDDLENLISSCTDCNRGKGAQSIINDVD